MSTYSEERHQGAGASSSESEVDVLVTSCMHKPQSASSGIMSSKEHSVCIRTPVPTQRGRKSSAEGSVQAMEHSTVFHKPHSRGHACTSRCKSSSAPTLELDTRTGHQEHTYCKTTVNFKLVDQTEQVD